MTLTSEKITVTEQMMFNNKLSRMSITGELGIPFSATEKQPITWKSLSDITEEDLDLVEQFFLNLQK